MDSTYVLTAVLFAVFMLATAYAVMRDPSSRYARALRMDPLVPLMPDAVIRRVRQREQWSLLVTVGLLLLTSALASANGLAFTSLAYPIIASVAVGRAVVLAFLDGREAAVAAQAGATLPHRLSPPAVYDRVPVISWGLFAFMTVVALVSYLAVVVNQSPDLTQVAVGIGISALLGVVGTFRFARWLVRQPSRASTSDEGRWVDALRTETLVWVTSASFPVALCMGTLVPSSELGAMDATLNLVIWYFVFFWALRSARRYVRPAPPSERRKPKKKPRLGSGER
jgi:hypothetical protein